MSGLVWKSGVALGVIWKSLEILDGTVDIKKWRDGSEVNDLMKNWNAMILICLYQIHLTSIHLQCSIPSTAQR